MQNENIKQSYDAVCKRVLSFRIILAHIMKSCVKEYKDLDTNYIANNCIEGTPVISEEFVDVDENMLPHLINNTGTEDSTVNEGKITYDIKFKAILPKINESVEFIINIEAQKDDSPGYNLNKRAIYYSSRLISSQKNKEFVGSDYDKIKKVYSIWIITEPKIKDENTITEYSFTEKNVYGKYKEDIQNYDLIDIIMLRLGRDKTNSNIIYLLNLVLKDNKDISSKEKKNILQNDYDIKVDSIFGKEIDEMCNLSQAVEDRGIAKGISIGESRGKVEGMLLLGADLPKIIELTGATEEEIEEIRKNMK